jgi:glutamate-5-semialdehyde dehydrogenase
MTTHTSLFNAVLAQGADARHALTQMALASTKTKNEALLAIAAALKDAEASILAANAKDYAAAEESGLSTASLDRLKLDDKRLQGIIDSVHDVAALEDPVGTILQTWERPNGLRFERVRTPLGVIGVIFESRPNVTVDAAVLCLKAGNAALLRAGSDSFLTSQALMQAMQSGLRGTDLPPTAVQLIQTRDREAVGAMLTGLNGTIDVIVPRGGKSLVARVQEEARVPVFAHLEGICHIYIHSAADLTMSCAVVHNAKLRRTGVCGALETLLVDQAVRETHLPVLVKNLLDAGCAVRGDVLTQAVDPRVTFATEEDWVTEYLDAIVSVKVVESLDSAIEHINTHGSHHTDSILTQDTLAAEEFLKRVDSAIVLHNASTQFADGGEFGFGAEIGISTGRMHARGPVGVEQLTSFNYRVRGNGQIRP